MVDGLAEHQARAAFVARASPQQNCSVERFNGTMRNELLNSELFDTPLNARVVDHSMGQVSPHSGPHRSLGMTTRSHNDSWPRRRQRLPPLGSRRSELRELASPGEVHPL